MLVSGRIRPVSGMSDVGIRPDTSGYPMCSYQEEIEA